MPRFHLPLPVGEISFVFSVPELKACLDFKLNSYFLSHEEQNIINLLDPALADKVSMQGEVSSLACAYALLHFSLSQLLDSSM